MSVTGDPDDYAEYLTIDRQTGIPSVIKAVADSDTAVFFIIVEVRHCDDVTVCFLSLSVHSLIVPSAMHAPSLPSLSSCLSQY